MDSSKPPKPAPLLDDLEAIRQLLEKEQLEPPLLTESLDDDLQIPLLSDIVEPGPGTIAPPPANTAPVASIPLPYPVQPARPAPASSTPPAASGAAPRDLIQNRLDGELRAAAQLILQDVIDDFVPQIEAELKRRLDARLDRLLKQPKP